MDFFNFFKGLERSSEAYFGIDSPLSQDLINYASKLKDLIQDVDDIKFKNKEFMKQVNSILIDFGEAVKLNINAEKVTFMLAPDDSIRAITTIKDKNNNSYVDLDKIADIEDIIITTEGYKYRNSKNKLLCIKLNKGLIQNCEAETIAGVIAHELGHCFQDGIFGVYKDTADIMYTAMMYQGANAVLSFRNCLPKFLQNLTKLPVVRLLFIFLTYLLQPHLLFTTGIFSGLGSNLYKLFNSGAFKKENEKTMRMKDQLEKIDNGDEKTKNDITNSLSTSVISELNKNNDRKKFINELEKTNKEEWKQYIENCQKIEPTISKFKEKWKNIVLQFDNMDRRIINILTLSRFTLKVYSKATFYKRWEFFADIFATSYGFGPETYSFLSNIITNNLNDYKDMGLYGKYHIYKTYLEDCNYESHGTIKQRYQNMYTDLIHELQNNTSLTASQKKDIQAQIDQMKDIAEKEYEVRKVDGNSMLVKAYNKLIDDRIDGISHDTEEKILKPLDEICKEIFVGKTKKEAQVSLESLIL